MKPILTHLQKLSNPAVLTLIVFGYLLLLAVIFMSTEINLALEVLDSTPALASEAQPNVSISSAEVPLQALPPVYESPVEPTYPQHIQEILDDPANFQNRERLLPGRAYLEGKTTKFLIGF